MTASSAPNDTDDVAAIAAIRSFHAHVYFDSPAQRAAAERLRALIGERFAVQLGRWHDVPVGPHSAPMFQVAFDNHSFAALVPWLMLNRGALAILVHPNTLAPFDDHLRHALWLGTPLPLRDDALPRRIDGAMQSDVAPNTAPTLKP